MDPGVEQRGLAGAVAAVELLEQHFARDAQAHADEADKHVDEALGVRVGALGVCKGSFFALGQAEHGAHAQADLVRPGGGGCAVSTEHGRGVAGLGLDQDCEKCVEHGGVDLGFFEAADLLDQVDDGCQVGHAAWLTGAGLFVVVQQAAAAAGAVEVDPLPGVNAVAFGRVATAGVAVVDVGGQRAATGAKPDAGGHVVGIHLAQRVAHAIGLDELEAQAVGLHAGARRGGQQREDVAAFLGAADGGGLCLVEVLLAGEVAGERVVSPDAELGLGLGLPLFRLVGGPAEHAAVWAGDEGQAGADDAVDAGVDGAGGD